MYLWPTLCCRVVVHRAAAITRSVRIWEKCLISARHGPSGPLRFFAAEASQPFGDSFAEGSSQVARFWSPSAAAAARTKGGHPSRRRQYKDVDKPTSFAACGFERYRLGKASPSPRSLALIDGGINECVCAVFFYGDRNQKTRTSWNQSSPPQRLPTNANQGRPMKTIQRRVGGQHPRVERERERERVVASGSNRSTISRIQCYS
jgi:hypothetical protein